MGKHIVANRHRSGGAGGMYLAATTAKLRLGKGKMQPEPMALQGSPIARNN